MRFPNVYMAHMWHNAYRIEEATVAFKVTRMLLGMTFRIFLKCYKIIIIQMYD